MKIKSKKTSRVQDVTQEQWTKMQTNGLARHFSIVSMQNTVVETTPEPEGVSKANFNTLLRKGNSEFKSGNYQEALNIWVEAKKIRTTPLLEKKMVEAENLLSAEDSES